MTEVYTSTQIDIPDVPDAQKEKVRYFLETRKGEFFKSSFLANQCGFKPRASQPELRKAITELITNDGCPIVSTAKGFAWAICANQIKFYVESLLHREQGLHRRIEKLNLIYKEMKEKEQRCL